MKFVNYPSDRASWVLQVAREWLRLGVLCDLTVICGADAGKNKSFQCHKILLLPFLKQFCAASHLADIEEVILPDTDPQELQQYLDSAYGLDSDGRSKTSFSWSDIDVLVKVKDEEEAYDEGENVGNIEEDYDYDDGKCPPKMEYNSLPTLVPIKFKYDKSFKKEEQRKRESFSCRLCDNVYTITTHYKKHFLKEHPGMEYITPKQQRIMNGVQKYICKDCGEQFNKSYDLKLHRSRAHLSSDSTETPCQICGKITSKSNLFRHFVSKHGEVICSCGETFSHESEFYDHKYSFDMSQQHQITSDNTTKCKISGDDGDEEDVTESIQTQKSYNHPCTRCHEAFPTVFLLRRHMLDDHWTELKEKNMLYKNKYKYHIKTLYCDYEGCERYRCHILEMIVDV